jgi:hypothetical protein
LIITNEFLGAENYYVIDVDLDIDTIEFGNDPIYCTYLLGSENILTVCVVTNCKELEFNTTKWGYGAVVYLIEVPTQTYDVHSVDFEDKTICIEDDKQTRWVDCTKCQLVQSSIFS